MFDSIKRLFQDPQATETDINLLLLGETGVGKSTFINSLSLYFKHSDFKKAQNEKISVLIPTCINSKTGEKIIGDEDEDEKHDKGAAATQNVKVYLFPIKTDKKRTFNLKLIDTPGVGDPRGLEQDNINLENVLTYLATLKKVHGICFLLKSNQSRFTKFVEYCLKEILSRLDKSASNNIIFITTYSKTYQYTPGVTMDDCLKVLVKDIQSKPPHVTIPLLQKNVFALDNEGFKTLLEIQDGKRFSKDEINSFAKSWKVSAKECRRLLAYIMGDNKNSPLEPHNVENTLSINEVRFLIEQLGTPLAEISDIIQDNLRLLQRHKKNLNIENQTLQQLSQQLYIPCVELKVTDLNQPVTVCTDTKCAEIVKVNDVTEWHYSQKCHNPCYLNGIPKERIGDPGLTQCAAMSGTENCTQCQCHWKLHMHIYKSTEKVQSQTEDSNVKTAIKDKEDGRQKIEVLIKSINKLMQELELESNIISDSIAKFSFFLQEHALTPFNDAYSDYIKQLIKNEKHLGKMADPDVIDKLEKLLIKHDKLQQSFQISTQTNSSTSLNLTPKSIRNCIDDLYKLKHMGPKIEELISKASSCRRKETQKNFGCIISSQINLISKTNNSEDYATYKESDLYSCYSFKTAKQETESRSDSDESYSVSSTVIDSLYSQKNNFETDDNQNMLRSKKTYQSIYSSRNDSDDESFVSSSTRSKQRLSSGNLSNRSRNSFRNGNLSKNSVYSSVYEDIDNSSLVSSTSHRSNHSRPSYYNVKTVKSSSSSSRHKKHSPDRNSNDNRLHKSGHRNSEGKVLNNATVVYDSDGNSYVVSSKSLKSSSSFSSKSNDTSVNCNLKRQQRKAASRTHSQYDSATYPSNYSDDDVTVVSSMSQRSKRSTQSDRKPNQQNYTSSRRTSDARRSSRNVQQIYSENTLSNYSDDDGGFTSSKLLTSKNSSGNYQHKQRELDRSGSYRKQLRNESDDESSIHKHSSNAQSSSRKTYGSDRHQTNLKKYSSSKSSRSTRSRTESDSEVDDNTYYIKSSFSSYK